MHSLRSDSAPHAALRDRPEAARTRVRAMRTGAALLAAGAVLAACSGGPSPVFSSAAYTGRIEPTVPRPAVVDRPAEAERAAEEERQRQLAAQAELDAAAGEAEVAESDVAPGDLRVDVEPPEAVEEVTRLDREEAVAQSPIAPPPPDPSDQPAATAAAPAPVVPAEPAVEAPAAAPQPTAPAAPAPRAAEPPPEPAPVRQAPPAPAPEPEPQPEAEPAEPGLSFGGQVAAQPERAGEPDAAGPDAGEPDAAGPDAASQDAATPLSFGGRERPPRPATSDTYPSLSGVPERPSDLPTVEERETIRRDLEASRAAGAAELGEVVDETTDAEPPPLPDVPDAPPAPVLASPPGDAAAETQAGPDADAAVASPAPGGPTAMGAVVFEAGSSSLPAAEAGRLASLAASLAETEGGVRVVGRASAGTRGDAPSPAAAEAIARERANAVASALIDGGVAPGRVRVVAAPADADADTADEASRTTEIFLDN